MKCKKCKGRGFIEIEIKTCANKKPERTRDDCDICNGSGKINEKKRNNNKYDFEL
jgi:DnaJ-class molecular chaperone